jgi:hypothetical protein
MTLERLLVDLHSRGVFLSVEGDRVRVDAPSEMVTTQLRQTLEVHKEELERLLKFRDATAETRVSQAATERQVTAEPTGASQTEEEANGAAEIAVQRCSRSARSPEKYGATWPEWKATALNRLFQEQGSIGEPGQITEATIRHGQSTACDR